MVEICVKAAQDKKAQQIEVYDVGEIIGIAGYFVVCSAGNDRLVSTIVDNILDRAREASYHNVGIEGDRQKEWVLVDFGSVIVHVFLNDVREFYRIERLFKDCEKFVFSDPVDESDSEPGSAQAI